MNTAMEPELELELQHHRYDTITFGWLGPVSIRAN